jgi:hypothetical protein
VKALKLLRSEPRLAAPPVYMPAGIAGVILRKLANSPVLRCPHKSLAPCGTRWKPIANHAPQVRHGETGAT